MLRLDERIPDLGFAQPSDALDAFLGWVADAGLTPYPHQEEAILEIFSGNHVVLDAPTGSGKSLVAIALHFKTFAALGKAWYTAPIKALVSEKFFELCKIFGAEHVGMMTGDATVNRDAPIVCCTAEILANLALREGPDAKVTSVVMDEFHYYGDRERGMAWQIPLLTLSQTTFLLMSATLGDTKAIRDDLEARTHRAVAEIRGVHRPVPLDFHYSEQPEHEAIAQLVRTGKSPVYIVHFTQNAATEQAQALMSTDWCTKEEKRAIQDAVKGFGFHSPFGASMRRFVLHGVGLHHAGLLPRYRLLVERLAQQGLLKIICGTDTLGVGINVPIRTVLFTQLCKFDGEKVGILPVREFKQIAGRAGRAGYDTRGFVYAQAPAHVIENAKIRANEGKGKKKVVKAQPPTRGYKHWDHDTFDQLVARPPEPLEPRFTVDHGRLLTLLQHAQERTGDARPGYDALLALIDTSHVPAARKLELRTESATLVANLEAAGIVVADGAGLKLAENLPHDFSLHHALSLFLVDALQTLDPASATYPLDVFSWVEAILEHPRAILTRQVDRAKTELIGELKASGVPYEERMEALEEVTWPKPRGEEIYAFFAAYAATHPWVTGEAIRPKSIAREMGEQWMSFADYVRDLGLQRSEGVLLRYLSDVYKLLRQNVPLDAQTDALTDLVAWLRATLAVVDASLVTEWEALLAGASPADPSPKHVDISSDRRTFHARIRAELHALVRALSRRDWDEAAASVRVRGDATWTGDEIAAALAPFLASDGEVAFDHRARQANQTVITPTGPHQWRVRQVLLPVAKSTTEQYSVAGWEEEVDEGSGFAVVGVIDLRDDTNPEGPLVELLAIDATS